MLDGTYRLSDKNGKILNHSGCVSGFAEYMVLPEQSAIKIREDMPLEQACFLGCAMPTGFGAVINVAQVKPGQSVAIWGMGGVGLNVVQGAKLRGAYPIFGVDLEGNKEGIAREFGVTHFINNSKEDPVPIIKEFTGGGTNFCFEVVGDPGATIQAYWAMGPKGKLVQIGGHRQDQGIALPLLFVSYGCQSIEGTTYGNVSAREDIPVFVDMIMRGAYKLDKLISRKFKLEEINDVIKAMEKRQILGRWICAFE
jgi:Zn-dependent alcohol dehydrogenase